ncbi:cupin domain-containing protein [bacterium]|nr:cupin domain-containing protein [bacterium]
MNIRNWRDQTPHVGHASAVTWLYFTADYDESWHDEPCCLQGVEAIAKQAVQGRKNSDYHVHEDMEQVQYVLSGTGIMRLDDAEYVIQPGDVIYIPAKVKHQFINNTEDWAEFLIISCMVDNPPPVPPIIKNWRDETPYVSHESAVIWSIYGHAGGSSGNSEKNYMQTLTHLVLHTIQGRRDSDYHAHGDMEQLYYILSGNAVVRANDEEYPVKEGDVVHFIPGEKHQLKNTGSDFWCEYLIFGANIRKTNS